MQRYPQQKESTEGYGVPFSGVVYIERDDFREQDSKDFYGLAPGKSVMLRCANCRARRQLSCTLIRILHRMNLATKLSMDSDGLAHGKSVMLRFACPHPPALLLCLPCREGRTPGVACCRRRAQYTLPQAGLTRCSKYLVTRQRQFCHLQRYRQRKG